MKKNSVLKTIMTILITSIITFAVTTLWMYGNTNSQKEISTIVGSTLSSDALTAKLQIIKNKIDSEYIGDVDENKLKEYIIKGYVAGLNDVYSQYFTANEMSDYTSDTLGQLVGIGIYLTKDTENNQIVIYGTIKNSPAEAAGLKAGDIITSVDGTACNGDDYDTITEKTKGKEGTKVTIMVKRNEEEKTFTIERKNIEIIEVTSQMLENNVGYIYISSFDGNAAEQFKNEYKDLISKGATSLIVDVRNNGGGVVDQATTIGDMFCDKGKILLIEKDKNSKEDITKAKTDKQITMKTVMLVNEYSASASELLAAILKDNADNVTVVGKKTFGKGVIQSLYQLTDGSGLKITTDEYFTPNHEKINKVGIEPDIKIEDYTFTGTLDTKNDTQLKKALEVLK